VRELKRKLIIGLFVPLSLAMIIAVAALAPSVVVARHKNKDDTLTTYTYGGTVTVQLPEGVPPHPTTLMIGAQHIERQGDYPMRGPHDVISFYIWIPSLNRFMPVIAISTNQNPEHQALIKEIYSGTPLWNPALGMENCYWIDKEELYTTKRGDVFFVNLTVGFHVSLDFSGSPMPLMQALGVLSFDLPPISMEVRGIDGSYSEENAGILPSGWSSEGWSLHKPAWVRLWIQEWTAGVGYPFRFAGVLGVHGRATLTPPPTV
jgi:hypothetical protein